MKHDQTPFNVRQAYGSSVSEKVTQFLPLVRKLAWYYQGHGSATIDVDDLMQAGMMALTEAAQRHDRPSDDGFAAYAKMRVRGAMVDLLRGQSHRPRSAVQPTDVLGRAVGGQAETEYADKYAYEAQP